VSTAGTVDGQVTFLSATSLPQNIGSPGTAVVTAVPEPASIAGLACGGLLLGGIAIRRRRS
jgi:hypothetical protein